MPALILARNQDNIIGVNGKLPWHISEDLKRFKSITMLYHNLVMGRKTFDSLDFALPGRHHWILTRDIQEFYKTSIVGEGVSAVQNIEQVEYELENQSKGKIYADYIVIGGAQIAKLLLPLIDNFYITKVYKTLQKSKNLQYEYFNIRLELFATRISTENHAEYSFELWKRSIPHSQYKLLQPAKK